MVSQAICAAAPHFILNLSNCRRLREVQADKPVPFEQRKEEP